MHGRHHVTEKLQLHRLPSTKVRTPGAGPGRAGQDEDGGSLLPSVHVRSGNEKNGNNLVTFPQGVL